MFNELEIKNRSTTLGRDLVSFVKSAAGTTLFALAAMGTQYAKDGYGLPLNPLEYSIDPSITELVPTVETIGRDVGIYGVQAACAIGAAVKSIGLAWNAVRIPGKILTGRYMANRKLRKLADEL